MTYSHFHQGWGEYFQNVFEYKCEYFTFLWMRIRMQIHPNDNVFECEYKYIAMYSWMHSRILLQKLTKFFPRRDNCFHVKLLHIFANKNNGTWYLKIGTWILSSYSISKKLCTTHASLPGLNTHHHNLLIGEVKLKRSYHSSAKCVNNRPVFIWFKQPCINLA